MTKEERLKWLKQIEKDIYVCSLDSTFADDAKSCAIRSAIEELENNRWIPVTERLPDKEGFYLVTIPRHANKIVTEFYSTDGWGKRNSFGWEITAWMPLPQPYERSER